MPPQATTLRRAKAQYKKSGPQLAPAEQRRIERAAELDRRAQAAKDREKRRKQAEKARLTREAKEHEARKQLGIGLATQLLGYSLTQKQLKGGMEGWLGVGGAAGGKKRKRDEDEDDAAEKENRGGNDLAEASNTGTEHESFSSNMSLDEALLDQLDGKKEDHVDAVAHLQGNPTNAHTTEDPDLSTESVNSTARQSISPNSKMGCTGTPPTKRIKTLSSPNDGWAQFLDGNTQILKEISQSPDRSKWSPDSAVIPPFSTQDLELDSDDLVETGLPKTANPRLSPNEGVIVRDFAYSSDPESSSFALKAPGAPSLPRKSRTEKSILRSFGRKPTIATPSPKMTATCGAFTAAQCSFTSDYHNYGLSTQLLQQALDDGDDDTEDEDEEVYSQALENSKIPDEVLMPPPPLRLSPTVYKPPGKTDLFAEKGGLQILGLSTQMLNDAIALDENNDIDDNSTDEDEDDALFSIPLKRPSAEEPSLPTNPDAAAPKATSTGASKYHALGLSTQVLNDAALDDIEFTDDEDTQGS